MAITLEQLVNGFTSLGVRPGETCLVHSSLSSFGHVEDGAPTVIRALLNALGANGTLMAPTLTGKITDSAECLPNFDVRTTPCWTGRIPETMRQMGEATRSLHPTHSACALGRRRAELVSGHENSLSPCDEHSPYYKNCAWGGSILLIGVDQESNTTIHTCEEIAGVPYHLQQDLVAIPFVGRHGETVVVHNRLHDWHKPRTNFNRLEPLLIEQKIMNVSRIGNATVRYIRAAGMLETVVATLKHDPLFLVEER